MVKFGEKNVYIATEVVVLCSVVFCRDCIFVVLFFLSSCKVVNFRFVVHVTFYSH